MKHLKTFGSFKVNESANNSITNGRYVILEKLPKGLKISFTEEGIEKATENNITSINFFDMFDDIQGNSEYKYFPDLGEVGFGLTSACGITFGYQYNDDGELLLPSSDDATAYYHNNYMITDFVEDILKDGSVIFNEA